MVSPGPPLHREHSWTSVQKVSQPVDNDERCGGNEEDEDIFDSRSSFRCHVSDVAFFIDKNGVTRKENAIGIRMRESWNLGG